MPWFTLGLLALAIVAAIFLAKAVPSSKPVLGKTAIVIAIFLAVLLLFRLSGIVEWGTYEYAFRILTTEGGMNAWLAARWPFCWRRPRPLAFPCSSRSRNGGG